MQCNIRVMHYDHMHYEQIHCIRDDERTAYVILGKGVRSMLRSLSCKTSTTTFDFRVVDITRPKSADPHIVKSSDTN